MEGSHPEIRPDVKKKQKPEWNSSFWKTTSMGNRGLHDCKRTYFDQPKEFTYSGDIEKVERGRAAQYALEHTAHGTLSLCHTPLRKTERAGIEVGRLEVPEGVSNYREAKETFVRPYSAPVHRQNALTNKNSKAKRKAKKASKPAWNHQFHLAIPGILRNRIHSGWCTQPTSGNNLRATDTYLLAPEKALEQALAATIYDKRDGALCVGNCAR